MTNKFLEDRAKLNELFKEYWEIERQIYKTEYDDIPFKVGDKVWVVSREIDAEIIGFHKIIPMYGEIIKINETVYYIRVEWDDYGKGDIPQVCYRTSPYIAMDIFHTLEEATNHSSRIRRHYSINT